MDKIIKHKKAYMKALEDSIVGNELNVSFPNVDSTSPYFTELNEEQEVTSFAYEMGNVLKGKIGGSNNGDNGDGGTSTSHNHDDRYAKIVHNHDNRYYTKIEVDEWRDRLINGDLLFNKINANHIQAGTIVAGSTIIANGAIGSAQISKVSADKLDAGIIDTAKITIAGANGNLKLRGNRLQVFEGIGSKQYERVSLGDVNNDGSVYGLRVRGADGNTILYDENGVYREGITDGSITNDKIGDDADIDGGKLNIHSVITNINENNTGTIHGTKIDIDGETVTSKVYKIELNQNEHSESIERQQSEIEQNKEQIALRVTNQKYTEDMGAMESRLDRTESEISVLNESIALTVTKTEVENQITEVKDFVADEIGDLSVGGANYLNNSAPRKATVDEFITWDRTLNGDHRLTYWQDYNDSVELPQVGYHPHIDLKTFHFPCIALINRNATWNMANRALTLKQEIHNPEEFIIPNETYVISFDAYSDTNLFSFHGGLYHKVSESSSYNYHSGRMDVSISSENVRTWKRYSFSFTTHKGINTSEPMYLIINGHNNPEGSGYIKNIKLEKGVIVSQWTPSQFDVDDSLNDAVDSMKEYTNSSIKELSASINIDLDSIKQKVSSSEKVITTHTEELGKIDGKIDTAKKDAISTASEDATKKSNQALSDAKDYVTKEITKTNDKVSQITTDLEGITSSVSSVETTTTSIKNKETQNKQNIRCCDLGMKINYSSFTLANDGEMYLHGYNEKDEPTDTNGVIYWNGKPQTITKCMVNPNADFGLSDCYLCTSIGSNGVFVGYYNEGWKYKWISGPTASGDLNIKGTYIAFGQFKMKNSEAIDYAYLYSTPVKLENAIGVSTYESRLSTAESKITDKAIINTVSGSFYTKNDIDSKGYQTSSQVQQTVDALEIKFSNSGGYNRIRNGGFENGVTHWSTNHSPSLDINNPWTHYDGTSLLVYYTREGEGIYQAFETVVGETYSYSFYIYSDGNMYAGIEAKSTHNVTSPGWQYVSGTFVATSTEHVFVAYGNSSSGAFYIDNVCVCVGKIPMEYSPHPSEVYDGITIIDRDGIQVQHHDNSFSRFNSNEMYQTNENGDRALSIRYGGYRVYQFKDNGNNASAYLGCMSSARDSTDGVYGTTIFGSSSSGFIDLGFSESNVDDNHKGINAWLRCVHYNGNGGFPSGTHSFKPFYMQNFSYYYARPTFYYGICFAYNGRDDLNSEVSFITTSSSSSSTYGTRYLNMYGADGINIGVQNGGNYTGHKIIEDSSGARLHHECWGDWYFNWWSIRNANIVSSLSNPIADINSKERLHTRDSYQIMSTKKMIQDRGEDFTMDGICIVEIPDDIKYSISKYDVNIIKYGRGDIWVSERTYDYFVVESENDIKFTWVLEGEMIDFVNRSFYAPYNIEEEFDESESATKKSCKTAPSSKYSLMHDV